MLHKPYVTPSPEAKIIGQVIFAFTQNIRSDELAAILSKYGLTSIQPDQWYPLQLCLDFEQAVAESTENGTESLVAIGMKFIDTCRFRRK